MWKRAKVTHVLRWRQASMVRFVYTEFKLFQIVDLDILIHIRDT